MLWVGFIFNIVWNTHLYYSNHIIDIFSFIFLFIVILNLYLLFFSSIHLCWIFDKIFVRNHRPRFLLSKQSVLFFIHNVRWYKSNQYINTTICSFLLTAISLVMCLLYLSKSFIFNNLSCFGAKDLFGLIFTGLALALFALHYFLSNNISVSKLFYKEVNIVIQDKPRIKCFIPRFIIYFMCNLMLWFQPSTSLLVS